MKHIEPSLCFLFIALLMAVSPAGAAELNWTAPQYVIGSSASLGRDLDLELDHQGSYHLAMAHDDVNTIWYSKWEEPTWTVNETAAVVTGTSGYFFSLDLFGIFPVIHFTDNQTGSMMWTMRAGSSWSPPDSVTGVYSFFVRSIVDESGYMHIMHLFKARLGDSIRYSTDKSGSWVHETISEIANPGYTQKEMDFALDSTGKPHFVWWDADEDAIFYAVRTGTSTYSISNIAAANDCKWMALTILDGDIPYFGWTNKESSGDYTINACFKIGSSFYRELITTSSRIVYATSLAVAVNEGFETQNIYFIYSNIDRELRYVYWSSSSGWVNDIIDTVAFPGVISSISAQWDAGRNAVGVAIREHTANDVYFLLGYVPSNPTPTPGPSPTPSPDNDIVLDLGPDMDYGAGDRMIGELDVANPGAAQSADVYVLLEVFGEFWFAPGWTQDLDRYTLSLVLGETRTVIYLPGFYLPDPLPSGGPFYFYAAAFTPGTLDADTIISNIEMKEFNLI